MNKKFKKFVIPAIAATIISGGALNAVIVSASAKDRPVEHEEKNDKNEQKDLAKKAKITEEDSIKIALEKVPGTAEDVELENEDGTVVYAVEVKAKDGSKQDVKIDAQSGKVIKIDNERDEQDNKKE